MKPHVPAAWRRAQILTVSEIDEAKPASRDEEEDTQPMFDDPPATQVIPAAAPAAPAASPVSTVTVRIRRP